MSISFDFIIKLLTWFKVLIYISRYILEKRLEQQDKKYQNTSIKNFVDLVGGRSSIPGGGCVAALVASLGASLATMVKKN